MKSINVNKLQAQISKVIKDVESGSTYEVMRYSRPVAYLVSKEEYEACKNHDCKKCIEDLRKLSRKIDK